MKNTHKALLVATTLLAGLSMGQAQTVLVDFNALDDPGYQSGTGAISANEPGFTAVNVSDWPAGLGGPGGLTVTDLAGSGIDFTLTSLNNDGGRLRSNGNNKLTGNPNIDFFIDGATANGGGGSEGLTQMSFDFTGLTANTDYTLKFWTWDNEFNNNDRTYQFKDALNGGALVGSVVLVGTVPPTSINDGVASTTFVLNSGAGAAISLDLSSIITSTGLGSRGVMVNGFSIASVPEPSIYALALGVFALGFLLIRRLRR